MFVLSWFNFPNRSKTVPFSACSGYDVPKYRIYLLAVRPMNQSGPTPVLLSATRRCNCGKGYHRINYPHASVVRLVHLDVPPTGSVGAGVTGAGVVGDGVGAGVSSGHLRRGRRVGR